MHSVEFSVQKMNVFVEFMVVVYSTWLQRGEEYWLLPALGGQLESWEILGEVSSWSTHVPSSRRFIFMRGNAITSGSGDLQMTKTWRGLSPHMQ